ncbi:hypothetical protein ACLB2K_032233 [Fragaria x ananassa]
MSTLFPLLFFLLLLFLQPLFSIANIHKLNQLRSELISQTISLNDTSPTLYFEVTKPIPVPKTKPCSQLILQHDFAYTYGKPPVFANYTPPSDCPSQNFSKIVLEWRATSKGRQFDRIFGVWLSGVELLRSCTAEPRTNGIVWSVEKDITRCMFHFMKMMSFGINPLLWRPITGIGSYDLPSYDIEITPFLGNILDGKSHKIGFNVTNALNVWYIDANLHIWLDKHSTRTEAQLVKHTSLPLAVSLVSDFEGLNGIFVTRTSRSVSSTGWVKSSNGNITTQSIQDFSYINKMVMGNDGNLQTVDQNIHFNDTVLIETPYSYVHSLRSNKTFPLYLYTDFLEQEDKTYLLVTNVDLGFIEKRSASGGSRLLESSLRNLQNAEGNMVVKNNLVVSGVGNTQQVYRYHGGQFCYFRNVSSSNYTILHDEVESTCHRKAKSNFDFGLRRLWPFGTGFI